MDMQNYISSLFFHFNYFEKVAVLTKIWKQLLLKELTLTCRNQYRHFKYQQLVMQNSCQLPMQSSDPFFIRCCRCTKQNNFYSTHLTQI